VGPDEVTELARVAAAMDGLPLALELAAARLRVLSAAQLAARIDDVLALLDPGATGPARSSVPVRHRTMDATVEWSYRTLPPDAARLLRWLSVFAAPVELSTVETVLGADPLDAVTTLVDKSLLQADGAGYRMPSQNTRVVSCPCHAIESVRFFDAPAISVMVGREMSR